MISVSSIRCTCDYRLHATFSDGTSGEYNGATLVADAGPMGQPLRDPAISAGCSSKTGHRPGRMVSTWRRSGCAVRSRTPAN